MSISTPFIHRPVGTTLLTMALAMAGMLAYFFLPVSPLPQVEFPTIQVQAGLPGASPETMASAVATPLEREFGHIAGVTEMTSSSSLGSTQITLQFDLSRNIDAAGRDVQAAINAAASQLPANLPSKPRYWKANPADPPVLMLSLTSEIYDRGQMFDAASTILQQKISQVDGVGQVNVWGGSLPAVRVQLNPTVVHNMGLSLEDVRAKLASANANTPKGQLSDDRRTWTLTTTDQLHTAKEYQPIIVAYRNGAPVRLTDIAEVNDSVEDLRNGGLADGKPSVMVAIFRQPNANIIETVDRVKELLPQLQASIPAAMKLEVAVDRTITIRASVQDIEQTLMLSVGLVVLVVFVFLRSVRSTLIPCVAVPISLIGTFGVMYLAGYSINNLSLMAMTIATGFVVDDAIVVVENITRYLEKGHKPLEAALLGAKEIGFTVLSISISLIAVFIPILLMGGIVGRYFREFAVTLSVAIAISLVISLTTAPMMCAWLLRYRRPEQHGKLYRVFEWLFDQALGFYRVTLAFVLRHPLITVLVLTSTVALNVYLYRVIPQDLFPQQDTGRINGNITADQNISSAQMRDLLKKYASIASSQTDYALRVVGFSGGGNTARMFVVLKPLAERKLSADQIKEILTEKVAKIPGATCVFTPQQDLQIGGRQARAMYQYTLQGDDLKELRSWAPKLLAEIQAIKGFVGVSSDQQDFGLLANLEIDRATAARLGISPAQLDNHLYDAFGQRQVSTMYKQLNQYHVVMEVDPRWAQSPEGLQHVYVHSKNGELIPISTFTNYTQESTPLGINHQSKFPSITISFNLKPGYSLSDAITEVGQVEREIGLPQSIHGKFSGTAQAYQDAKADQPFLIAAALAAVYIVLGILYESFIHPITIISTLPSAGVGALLALLIFKTPLTVIAMIGIILLIGIVKKNAIMMIDFAITAEREQGMTPKEAIYHACLLRFRPITMTTMAAILGGLPLALGTGVGSELRRPLGLAIVGGLMFSQLLTLYTTPVIYIYMDRFRIWCRRILLPNPQLTLPVGATLGQSPSVVISQTRTKDMP